MRFKQLDALERALYRVSLLSAALAIALLVSPVAYHRWVFRRHEKGRLLRYANTQAIVGLGMVALAVCVAVWMVLLFVGLNWPTALLAAVVTGCFVALWFVFPIADRIGADRQTGGGPVRAEWCPPMPRRPRAISFTGRTSLRRCFPESECSDHQIRGSFRSKVFGYPTPTRR